ncbi:MAG TPA: pantetheine-phosphate adenylyltransferase [Kiritimatiellia bacterium]|jgi:pantetheine-phosphate adenylyltransferase|nr:pantetheine-phosphate adenylyltransferase [Kiritimatiellia bacterium]HOR97063.1 pantetheine-phosphate adenylyltransferase [Kiritimatiellia bacterium]HRU19315.1 pantetheine-phosphate adenylyltransferase [Kiritimatiellia bacterium]
MEKIVVYPGTFDPLTLGHFDLLRRSASLFDQVIVVVADVSVKAGGMFNLQERMAMIRESVDEVGMTNIEIDRLDCLLVDYCRRRKVRVVVRGVRVYSDFEYEFQMALTNRKLAPEIETLFMMPNENYSYVTASTIREIARYGGDTSAFVPAPVQKYIRAHMSRHPDPHIRAGGGIGNTGAFDR